MGCTCHDDALHHHLLGLICVSGLQRLPRGSDCVSTHTPLRRWRTPKPRHLPVSGRQVAGSPARMARLCLSDPAPEYQYLVLSNSMRAGSEEPTSWLMVVDLADHLPPVPLQ